MKNATLPRPSATPEALRAGHVAVQQLMIATKDVQQRTRDMVEEVRQGIVGQSGIACEHLPTDHEQSRQVWEEMKQERYALLAVLLEDVWRDFRADADQSPSGLVEYWNGQRSIVTSDKFANAKDRIGAIASSMRNMYMGVIEKWSARMDAAAEASRDEPRDKAYSRMSDMNAFAHRHDIHSHDTGFYISNGFSGALQMSYGVAQVIPVVYKRDMGSDIKPEEYGRLLQASYAKFMVRPAHLNKTVGIPMMNAGFRPSSSDTFIGFRMDPAMLRMDGGNMVPLYESVPADQLERAMREQIGCPGLYAKEDGTGRHVNRAFFDHFVKVVTEQHIGKLTA